MPIEADAGMVIAEMENRRGSLNEGRKSMLEMAPLLSQYKMPPTRVGSSVVWYRHASRSSRPALGFVARYSVDSQNIDILIPTEGDAVESVPHISDPRIELGFEHSSSGAWDYTDEHKENAQIRQEIEERVAKLESKFNAISGKLNKAT